MSTREAWAASPKKSIKISSYFPAYDLLFEKYRGTSPVILEVGILSGGSLFMWRDYFGEGARIIGAEYNPNAVKWREHGFEIFIGDQSSETFWADVFAQVGPVDIVIDDGGHTNLQQLRTLHAALPHIRDGGVVLIEDTQTSDMKTFGNPSRYSFMNFAGRALHILNDRFFHRGPPSDIRESVHSIQAFDGIVAFHVDRRLCGRSEVVSNGAEDDSAVDMRVSGGEAEARRTGSRLMAKIRRKRGIWALRIENWLKCRPYF